MPQTSGLDGPATIPLVAFERAIAHRDEAIIRLREACFRHRTAEIRLAEQEEVHTDIENDLGNAIRDRRCPPDILNWIRRVKGDSLRYIQELEHDCDDCMSDIEKWEKRMRGAEQDIENMRFEVLEDDG